MAVSWIRSTLPSTPPVQSGVSVSSLILVDQVISFFFALQSFPPHPLHHPKPDAGAFSEADVVGQGDVALEVEGEGEEFLFFEGQGFDVFESGDAEVYGLFDEPADAFCEGEDVAGEDAFQQAGLFGGLVVEFLPAGVVVLVQGQPVEEAVVEGVLPELDAVVVGAQILDGIGALVLADAQLDIGLLEEVVDFLGAGLQANDAGLAVRDLVLDERIAVDDLALVEVVVEKGTGPPGLFDDGGPKAGHLIGEEVLVEANSEVFDLGHRNVSLAYDKTVLAPFVRNYLLGNSR